MKIVTLCGSMRFFEEMQEIAVELETKYDCCVVIPIGGKKKALDNAAIEKLAKAHYKKIDMADAVYIVNIGGYIGEAVREELRYAKMHDKDIIFHEAIKG